MRCLAVPCFLTAGAVLGVAACRDTSFPQESRRGFAWVQAGSIEAHSMRSVKYDRHRCPEHNGWNWKALSGHRTQLAKMRFLTKCSISMSHFNREVCRTVKLYLILRKICQQTTKVPHELQCRSLINVVLNDKINGS